MQKREDNKTVSKSKYYKLIRKNLHLQKYIDLFLSAFTYISNNVKEN